MLDAINLELRYISTQLGEDPSVVAADSSSGKTSRQV
jgi:hypothetical protein